ncbi:aminodeoxychorismate/anthranilate synthase component II [Opitutales bacterium]|nr:aminodeoxychorismate/anthranilate synthase component II [Opitutales bacterium]
MNLLVIDNYDSFTYNLVQYFGESGATCKVIRNDEATLDEIDIKPFDGLVLSPGPCAPEQAGISLEAVNHWAGKKPLLGVCLGHQCIGQAYGGKIVRADRLMHGKTSPVRHHGIEIFENLPNPFSATRYHSLIIDPKTMPDELEMTAWTDENEIMAIRHRELPLWGVQFHPESLATDSGIMVLNNFLKYC